MKRIIITILALITFISVDARVRYVSTRGNDLNAGTDSSATGAWLTWTKGITEAYPGDTIYFMGGTYYTTAPIVINGDNSYDAWPNGIGRSGTAGNPIMYSSYPGQWAVLDCRQNCDSKIPGENFFNAAFKIYTTGWTHFKDFEIKNVFQCDSVLDGGITAYNVVYLTFEHIVLHDVSQRGIVVQSGAYKTFYEAGYGVPYNFPAPYFDFDIDTTRFINCDVYDLCDTLTNVSGADAYHTSMVSGNVYIWEGCRLWNYSDDGFNAAGGTGGKRIMNNCWVMPSNKYYSVNGYVTERNGFKTGWLWDDFNGGLADWPIPDHNTLEVSNCLVMFAEAGFREGPNNIGFYHNNTAYGCKYSFQGAAAYRSNYYDDPFRPSYKNNLIFKERLLNPWNKPYLVDLYLGDPSLSYDPRAVSYDESNNSWSQKLVPPYYDLNEALYPTYADFVGLTDDWETDSLYLVSVFTAPRKADGSLPDVKPLMLKAGSKLIDAGTRYISIGTQNEDKTLLTTEYYGAAPDIGYSEYAPIIADHTVVDQFDDIPANWIDSVKTMWLSYPGESHAYGFMNGLEAFEALYPAYAVDTKNYTEGGTPDGYTDQNLRASTALWGDYASSTGWIYIIGEDDWWTNSTGVGRVKASLSYTNTNGPALSALGFGWCWDHTRENVSVGVDPITGNHWYGKSVGSPDGDMAWGIDDADNAITGNSVNMDTYLDATQSYIDYCADSIPTTVFFSTAPPDTWDGTIGVEALYQGYLKNEHIREYVIADPSRILFDYADIICYNNSNELATATWNGNTFPTYHTDNDVGGYIGGHIGVVGEVRLAKAMWWLLARIAGWDGLAIPEEDSTATDILTFTLTDQTGAATINATNHTVAIEVAYTADVTALAPTITMDYGATISPLSGVSRDFTSPVTYTVTALDGTTTQVWTVIVTQEEEPGEPPVYPEDSLIIRYNGKIIRL